MIDYLNIGKYCIYNKSTQTKENYILGKIIECYNNQYYVVSIGTSLECIKVYDDSLITIIEESSNLPEALGEYFGGSSQVQEYYKVNGNDLNSLANTIMTKGSTSSPLEFNSGFESAIENIETITVEQLDVVNNGTTTVPQGKAYSPVNVNVPWLMQGPNPVENLGVIYEEETALKDTDYATWTPSTTSAVIQATSVGTTFTADMANYEYFLLWEFEFDPVYIDSASQIAMTTQFFYINAQCMAKRPSTLQMLQQSSFNGNFQSGISTNAFLIYYSKIGAL